MKARNKILTNEMKLPGWWYLIIVTILLSCPTSERATLAAFYSFAFVMPKLLEVQEKLACCKSRTEE